MSDLTQFKPGEKVTDRLTVSAFNNVVNVVDWLNQHKMHGGAKEATGRTLSSDEVYIYNDSGSDLGRFEVLQITGFRFDTTDQNEVEEFKNKPYLVGDTPDDSGKTFAVLQQPCAAGDLAIARVSGISPVKLDCSGLSEDDKPRYATTSNGVTDQLTPSNLGGAEIVWFDLDSEWALIKVGNQRGQRYARITDDAGDNGYPWTEQIPDGSGGFTDGDDFENLYEIGGSTAPHSDLVNLMPVPIFPGRGQDWYFDRPIENCPPTES